MLTIQTKLTSQGQVSVPAAVRHLLGLTAGAALQWEEVDGRITVQRATQHDTLAAHQALFGDEGRPAPRTLAQLKQGIAKHIKQRHART